MKQYWTIALLMSAGVCAAARGQTEALASFRMWEAWPQPAYTLKEVAREPRVSHFWVSNARTNDARAFFVLCALSEAAHDRGFSHFAILQPESGGFDYTLGLFNSADEALEVAFGPGAHLDRALGSKPGAVSTVQEMCPKKGAQ